MTAKDYLNRPFILNNKINDKLAKLGKGANITTDVLLKICEAMDCKLEDIMETIKD